MNVVPYDPKYKNNFIELNKAWISEMFVMEPEDERELGNIEPYLNAGGQIFFALDDAENVMACCLIAPREDGDWEIMKFAASQHYKGAGAGSACPESLYRLRQEQENRKSDHCFKQKVCTSPPSVSEIWIHGNPR